MSENVSWDKLSSKDIKTVAINEATVAIIDAYLEYAGKIVGDALNQQSYASSFKEINDDLVIKPDELIDLIDQVQKALLSARDRSK